MAKKATKKPAEKTTIKKSAAKGPVKKSADVKKKPAMAVDKKDLKTESKKEIKKIDVKKTEEKKVELKKVKSEGEDKKSKEPKEVKAAAVEGSKVDSETLKKWQDLKKKYGNIKASSYKMTEIFESNQPLQHKVLGWGYVLSSLNDRLEVIFESGVRQLISNYKAR